MADDAASLTKFPDGSGHLRVQWDAPLDPMRILQLSKEEASEGLVSGSIPKAPFHELVNFVITEADPDRVVVELVLDERHLNPVGAVAGGMIATVLDSAMWCVVQLAMVDKSIFSTVNMNINFTRSVSLQHGTIRAVANTLHVGRSTITAEAHLLDGADKRYAHATASFVRIGGLNGSDGYPQQRP
ncbi:PaaI family thioesterase [Antrihabitans cavernicola]|uniref:PaaI family thioesterase n=1 Tax=Antrihabitans cavernicola TaxID=2495913 RepID=A0A5A7SE77_9NOCA|nr:PaaI family thioesterase [Spelaeibacter cavernicola]KAA0024166.1 PaaI family thioesterase [Spelaeibacter cavernicola]